MYIKTGIQLQRLTLFAERAKRARMREERQWLMASGEFHPEELKNSFGQEEESKESEVEKRPSSRNREVTEDIELEDRDEDLYTGMYKGIRSFERSLHADINDLMQMP